MNKTTNLNTSNTNTEINVGEQTMNNPTVAQDLFIDLSSLSGFFIDVTEYIYDNQHGEGGTVTALEIARYAMNLADSQDNEGLSTISGLIDLMAELGWLDINLVGTTLDDDLLYEFNSIEQGEAHV